MALPKRHRLRRRQDFDRVYRRGKRSASQNLRLNALRLKQPLNAADQVIQANTVTASTSSPGDRLRPASSASRPELPVQVAVVVSQKVSKRAVVRNRIRRQLQAGLARLLPELGKGWLLIIRVQPNAVNCEFDQFLQELKQLLIDAEVLHGSS
ncbi:MAG: ribonuclease P protein component [Cyanobacteria bacterium P01_H01_bin.121]